MAHAHRSKDNLVASLLRSRFETEPGGADVVSETTSASTPTMPEGCPQGSGRGRGSAVGARGRGGRGRGGRCRDPNLSGELAGTSAATTPQTPAVTTPGTPPVAATRTPEELASPSTPAPQGQRPPMVEPVRRGGRGRAAAVDARGRGRRGRGRGRRDPHLGGQPPVPSRKLADLVNLDEFVVKNVTGNLFDAGDGAPEDAMANCDLHIGRQVSARPWWSQCSLFFK